jgi:predicted patatin/cPLA2 family phospholipase
MAMVLSSVNAGKNGKCYALALQSGGDKAAYQAGALAEIVAELGEGAQYDIITGVGIGAINGAIMASHEKGDEQAAVDEIIQFWQKLSSSDFYKSWAWGGEVRGLLFESSLYDSSPFRKMLTGLLKQPVRPFRTLATKASDGRPTFWDETTPLETLIKAIDASAAYPGFFKPVDDIDEEIYYDGGTSFSIDIGGAINWCKDNGYAEEDIVIDTILNTAATIKDKETKDYTSIPMLIRYLEIRLFYNTMDLLERAKDAYRTVDFRFTIAPTRHLESGLLPFNFNAKQIKKNLQAGRDDVKSAIAQGDRVMTDLLITYTGMKNNHTFMGDYNDFLSVHLPQL